MFVDGGLLSNYPLWLFRDSPFPTVGVKLLSKQLWNVTPGGGFIEYCMSLLATVLGAHDKLGLGSPVDAIDLQIDATFVQGTDFNIEDTPRDLLFGRGHMAASQFNWSALPPQRSTDYDDPHAAEMLEATARSIEKVFERTKTHSPPKRAYDYYRLAYYLEDDGSGMEQKHFLIRNNGSQPISMLRQGLSYDYPVEVSFKELAIEIASCIPSTCEVVILPSKNTRLAKEYVLMFIPPIAPGGTREVQIRTRAPKAFLNLVNTKRDNFGLELDHEDGVHMASLTLHVRKSLGRLEVRGEAGGTQKNDFTAIEDRKGYEYGEYTWTFGPVTAPFDFKVAVGLR